MSFNGLANPMRSEDPIRIIEQVKAFHNQIISEISSSEKNLESLPKNATIRSEYVKCGRNCKKCLKMTYHGPYLYAYWRLHGKLVKKYIGR